MGLKPTQMVKHGAWGNAGPVAEVLSPREVELLGVLKRLRTVQDAAMQAKRFADATKAIAEEQKALKDLATLAQARRIAAIKDPVAKLEAMSRAAMDAGSHVAAQKSAQEAQRLRAQQDVSAQRAAAAAMDDLDDEAMLQALLFEIQNLPREMAIRIGVAVLDRPDIDEDDILDPEYVADE